MLLLLAMLMDKAFGDQDGVSSSVSAGNCQDLMATYCSGVAYNAPTLMDMADASAQIVAGFLIARGPHWFGC
jgi:hypothetical protein